MVVYIPPMANKTVTRSEFARMAGVAPASVTAACKKSLAPALIGKRIDAAHPAAVEYLNKTDRIQTPPPKVDPLYPEAIELGITSAEGLRKQFGIGYNRATRLVTMMRESGLVDMAPGKDAEKKPAPAPKPPKERGPSGHTKRNIDRKAASLQDLSQGKTLHAIPDDIERFSDMTLRELVARFGTDTAFLDWLKATKEIETINEKRIKNAQSRGELVSREVVKVGIIEPINTAHVRMMTDGAKTIATRVVAMHNAGRTHADIVKFVADQIASFIRPVKAKTERTLQNA